MKIASTSRLRLGGTIQGEAAKEKKTRARPLQDWLVKLAPRNRPTPAATAPAAPRSVDELRTTTAFGTIEGIDLASVGKLTIEKLYELTYNRYYLALQWGLEPAGGSLITNPAKAQKSRAALERLCTDLGWLLLDRTLRACRPPTFPPIVAGNDGVPMEPRVVYRWQEIARWRPPGFPPSVELELRGLPSVREAVHELAKKQLSTERLLSFSIHQQVITLQQPGDTPSLLSLAQRLLAHTKAGVHSDLLDAFQAVERLDSAERLDWLKVQIWRAQTEQLFELSQAMPVVLDPGDTHSIDSLTAEALHKGPAFLAALRQAADKSLTLIEQKQALDLGLSIPSTLNSVPKTTIAALDLIAKRIADTDLRGFACTYAGAQIEWQDVADEATAAQHAVAYADQFRDLLPPEAASAKEQLIKELMKFPRDLDALGKQRAQLAWWSSSAALQEARQTRDLSPPVFDLGVDTADPEAIMSKLVETASSRLLQAHLLTKPLGQLGIKFTPSANSPAYELLALATQVQAVARQPVSKLEGTPMSVAWVGRHRRIGTDAPAALKPGTLRLEAWDSAYEAALQTIAEAQRLGRPIGYLEMLDHGSAGNQRLGDQSIREQTPAILFISLLALRPYLAKDAVIYLGGCNVGSDPAFVEQFAKLMGVTVVAGKVPQYAQIEGIDGPYIQCAPNGGCTDHR